MLECLLVLSSPPPLQVDRVSYLLQEIYGIENKNNQETKVREGTLTLPPGHLSARKMLD